MLEQQHVFRVTSLICRIQTRDAASGASAAYIFGINPNPALADTPANTSSATLLSLIPPMRFGAPATNATISKYLAVEIETMAASLESLDMRDNAKSPLLSGSWRLVYSNGAEITSLAAQLPLGFCLGKTFQPLDTSAGFFENKGRVEHPLGLARLQTNVVGDVHVAQPGTVNAVGVVNDKGNRVDVDFRVITFQLDEVFGIPIAGFQKSLTPKADPEKAQPANDVTYLDKTTRIVRGGEGA
eukprot:CAMPEP_0119026506 /NCGR_PEP_ID=MMETSP1176-20130426/35582_1 /TAXON_ID=265551 /ORGANISM="Synedropsis recta cf, Strain CCMP1620" /LENGTH=241 /DNA_ID=CAMNT_0006982235 /DNA_START=1 /DNA_END=723 /DNA_ORIENTATION=+